MSNEFEEIEFEYENEAEIISRCGLIRSDYLKIFMIKHSLHSIIQYEENEKNGIIDALESEGIDAGTFFASALVGIEKLEEYGYNIHLENYREMFPIIKEDVRQMYEKIKVLKKEVIEFNKVGQIPNVEEEFIVDIPFDFEKYDLIAELEELRLKD